MTQSNLLVKAGNRTFTEIERLPNLQSIKLCKKMTFEFKRFSIDLLCIFACIDQHEY